MYLHVGWNEVVGAAEILAVCDYQSWQESGVNSSMTEMARVAGKMRLIGEKRGAARDDVRSVIVCREEILLSPITSSTLRRRADGSALMAASGGEEEEG